MSVNCNYSSATNSNEFSDSCETQELCANNSDCYVNNLVNLPTKSETYILSYLRDRIERDIYYTWAGRSLIAIRPYAKNCNFNRVVDSNSPSIESVASQALFRMEHQIGKSNQTIIITGESGSGKTYSLAVALKHIGKIQNSSDTYAKDLLTRAWYTVPLLTAFGNAATSHNGDSSRFGQLFELRYDKESIALKSVRVKTFLLEKSRVSGPNYGEGNFHIFQQILMYESNDFLRTLQLSKNVNYKICNNNNNNKLNGGDVRFNKDTLRMYNETLESMDNFDIKRQKIVIYKILSTILNLGNVRFCLWNDNYIVTVDSMVHIENVGKLLETNVDLLKNIFTTRIVSVNNRSSIYKVPCTTKNECENRRNALMRYLYEKLFVWIVKQINKTIDDVTRIDRLDSHLGILDVYGFETFDNNLFEQLCINYANEKLQWYFVDNYFKEEEYFQCALASKFREEYLERIDLFDSYLFNILDEVCMSNTISDVDGVLMARLNEELKNKKNFNILLKTKNEFIINHYAGPVKYDVRNMISKNTDKVPEEFVHFLKTKCKFSFLKTIIDKSNVSLKMQTILMKFKKSLNKLMVVLNCSDILYIKCIKTNNFHIENYLDENYFKSQLYANGIFEILKLSFQGYTIKLPLDSYGRYLLNIINIVSNDLQLSIHYDTKNIFMNEDEYIFFKKLHGFIKFYAANKIAFFIWKHEKLKKEFNLKASQAKTILNVTKRKIYRIDNLITYSKIPDFKIIFHTSRTCILNSHMLPRHIKIKGLPDIL